MIQFGCAPAHTHSTLTSRVLQSSSGVAIACKMFCCATST